MCCNNSKILAFSLAELMVLLLALSIMLAAAAPVVTKRQPSETTTALPGGSILVWCDIASNIPDDYLVCDTANHGNHPQIPDLTNRFVIGAGGAYPFRDPSSDPVTSTQQLGGCSSLTNCSHAFSLNEIPSHLHSSGSLASNTFNHTHSVTLADSGAHSHADVLTAADPGHRHNVPASIYAVSGATLQGYFLGSTSNATIAPIASYIGGGKHVGVGGMTTGGSSHAHAGYTTSPFGHSHGGTLISTSDGAHDHATTVGNAGKNPPNSFDLLYKYKNCYYIIKKVDSSW